MFSFITVAVVVVSLHSSRYPNKTHAFLARFPGPGMHSLLRRGPSIQSDMIVSPSICAIITQRMHGEPFITAAPSVQLGRTDDIDFAPCFRFIGFCPDTHCSSLSPALGSVYSCFPLSSRPCQVAYLRFLWIFK